MISWKRGTNLDKTELTRAWTLSVCHLSSKFILGRVSRAKSTTFSSKSLNSCDLTLSVDILPVSDTHSTSLLAYTLKTSELLPQSTVELHNHQVNNFSWKPLR